MTSNESSDSDNKLQKLTNTNKALCDIINSMVDTIFTINRDRTINPEYSPSLYSLVDIMQLEDGRFPDIFGYDEKKITEVQEWLDILFTRLDLDLSDLVSLAPITEMQFGTGQSVQYYSVLYSGLFGDEGLRKIVVNLRNITQEKQLKLKVEEAKKTHEDALEQISHIVKLDNDTFESFILDCKKTITEIQIFLESSCNTSCVSENVRDVLRSVHTLKGNARAFGFSQLGEVAHLVEDSLCVVRDGKQQMPEDFFATLKAKIDTLQTKVEYITELCKTIIQGKDTGLTRTGNRDVFLRIKLDKIHNLRNAVSTLRSQKQILTPEMAELVEDLHRSVDNLRRTPANRLFNRFPKMVNDLSITLRKNCNISIHGGEIEVDIDLLERIGNAIVHMVRNAVDHGIETPEERAMAGKETTGQIKLQLSKSDNVLTLEVSDDGRGIDKEMVIQKALNLGLLSDEDVKNITEQDVYAIIFKPGFSTSAIVTDISGRGVGMDVVATTIAELKGNIDIKSKQGQGITFLCTFSEQATQDEHFSVAWDESTLIIGLRDRLTSSGMNNLRMLTNEATQGNVDKIILNISELVLLPSEFIGYIVSLHLSLKEKGKKLLLRNTNPLHEGPLKDMHINEIAEIVTC